MLTMLGFGVPCEPCVQSPLLSYLACQRAALAAPVAPVPACCTPAPDIVHTPKSAIILPRLSMTSIPQHNTRALCHTPNHTHRSSL